MLVRSPKSFWMCSSVKNNWPDHAAPMLTVLCGIKCKLSIMNASVTITTSCVLFSVDRPNKLQVSHPQGAARGDMEQDCDGEVEHEM